MGCPASSRCFASVAITALPVTPWRGVFIIRPIHDAGAKAGPGKPAGSADPPPGAAALDTVAGPPPGCRSTSGSPRLHRSIPILACLLIAVATGASASANALDAFRAGDWAAVVREGRNESTVDSLILAGRATLSIAGYQTTQKAQALALVAEAEADFDKALARAPGNVDAQLQKAVAIGYRAQLTRGIGLAKEARRRFEAIRAAHPDNSLAWSALGGWHGGSIAAVGSFLAGTTLGAKRSEMERCYAQALKLAPAQPSTRTFYAITLMDLDEDNAARAAAVLKGIENLPAPDGFEALLKRQGIELAAALAKGDAKAAQATARRLKAFARIG
jgi:tetratricopeptide (TPR) repeat protein